MNDDLVFFGARVARNCEVFVDGKGKGRGGGS
jgi:hypothetical protein